MKMKFNMDLLKDKLSHNLKNLIWLKKKFLKETPKRKLRKVKYMMKISYYAIYSLNN